MEIGGRNIHSGDEPDQVGKGEGLAGDNDHHYVPGLPVEHPMTVSPSPFQTVHSASEPLSTSSPTPQTTVVLLIPPTGPTRQITHTMMPCGDLWLMMRDQDLL